MYDKLEKGQVKSKQQVFNPLFKRFLFEMLSIHKKNKKLCKLSRDKMSPNRALACVNSELTRWLANFLVTQEKDIDIDIEHNN